MPRARLILAATALAAACHAPTPTPTSVPQTAPATVELPADATWKQVMHTLGDQYDVLDKNLGKAPIGDVQAAAAAAYAGADLVKLGYGRFRDDKVPNFARLARDCESWLLQIAVEARQGHGELARELFRRDGEARACARCHDACKAAGR